MKGYSNNTNYMSIRRKAPNYRMVLKLGSEVKRPDDDIKNAEQFLHSVGKDEGVVVSQKDILEHKRWLEDRGISDLGISTRMSSLGKYLSFAGHSLEAEELRLELRREYQKRHEKGK